MTTLRDRDFYSAAAAAVMHCLVTQQEDGYWESSSAGSIAETAVACVALLDSKDDASRAAVARARSWLSGQTVTPAEGLRGLVEGALWALAMDDTLPVEVSDSAGDSPEAERWLRLVMAIALYRDRAVRPGLPVAALRASLQEAMRDRPTPEDITAYVLVEAPTPQREAARLAAGRLASALAEAGDTTDPLTASLHLLMHAAVDPGGETAQRHRSWLHRSQRFDGTWCFSTPCVRGTALTLRALREYPAFAAHALPRTVSFLRAAQHEDGGWPAFPGARSDSGTTALVLDAVAGLDLPATVVLPALAFLDRHMTADSLWTANPSIGEDKAPCEETIAHVVAAMRQCSDALAPSVTSARRWLAKRAGNGNPVQGRLYGLPYAVFRTAEALGWEEPAGRDTAGRLIQLQNADGGWPQAHGGTSTPAATGVALAALGTAGLLDTGLWKSGTDFLLLNRRRDGSWPAEPLMTEPYPLALSCSALTHAFAVMGLHSAWKFAATEEVTTGPGHASEGPAQRKARHGQTPEDRPRPGTGDSFSVPVGRLPSL